MTPEFHKLLLVLSLSTAIVFPADSVPTSLTDISLEDLLNVEVTSVSRKNQKLSKAGAAVYVITQEDIRRSGMTNIPDILRMAPGVNVARIAANSWAISVRGFNDKFSTKVLVLIDGRTVYTQEYSGVQWDQQAVPIEDIERIEVIRGPGGTVWGANAVNGVINILTRHSKDTEGQMVSLASGSQDIAQGLLRSGGKVGKLGFYRVYGRYTKNRNSFFEDGPAAADAAQGMQLGFRSDLELSSRDSLTLQGDMFKYEGRQNINVVIPREMYRSATIDDPLKANNQNLLGRWKHAFDNGSDSTLQVYHSRVRRREQGLDRQNTSDLDFQYHFRLGRHDLVSTAGYRHATLLFKSDYGLSFTSPLPSSRLFSTSLQDEITLPFNLALMVGSKFEHNSFTGFEIEPSAQLIWTPTERTTLWTSVARAIRQPSWFDTNGHLDITTFPIVGGGLGLVQVHGNPNFQVEQLLDFQVGYRKQLSKQVTLDATAFRSHYNQLSTLESQPTYFAHSPAPPHLVVPSWVQNQASARNYGGEVFLNWRVNNRWRITPAYSFLQTDVYRDSTSLDTFFEASKGKDPKHQWQLRSNVNLPHNFEWDTSAYFVSNLRTKAYGETPFVPSYTRLDARIGRKIGESAEWSITGQHLLQPRHHEFVSSYLFNVTQVSRAIVARVRWTF